MKLLIFLNFIITTVSFQFDSRSTRLTPNIQLIGRFSRKSCQQRALIPLFAKISNFASDMLAFILKQSKTDATRASNPGDITDEENSSESEEATKKKRKKKKKKSSVQNCDENEHNQTEASSLVSTCELTVEQKVKRDNPSSRIRFTESAQPGFVMMGLDKVGLMYGNEVVLKNASFTVTTGERVGLVGPNGGGKSTMLRILAGELEATTGDIVKSSSTLRVAFLRQEFVESLVPNNTLKDELLSVFVEERQLLADIARIEDEVSKYGTDKYFGNIDESMEELQRLQQQAETRKVYALESKVYKIMNALGFRTTGNNNVVKNNDNTTSSKNISNEMIVVSDNSVVATVLDTNDDSNALVSSFSGGWKMRIGLAKILLLDPNIVLLDEPTNHMDLDSVIWLESFLVRQNLPIVVVSHDREFLDRVCNKMVDIDYGVTTSYSGCNYSKYLQQRTQRVNAWRDKNEEQRRYVKEEEKWIKKAKSDPNLGQNVKAREAALLKFRNSDQWVGSPPRDRKFLFRFPPAPRCGNSLFEMQNVSHGYGNRWLFRDVDLQLSKGDRVGFIGPNGAGKSTLMRIINSMEEPRSGYARFVSSTVTAGYYAQNQADALNPDLTVFETIREGLTLRPERDSKEDNNAYHGYISKKDASAPKEYTITELRTLLSQFMFKGDNADKKIRVLSGGEKSRVALCKLMLRPNNLLLLDEPTNHLDIVSKEVLEEALLNYGGTVVVISHDRYFLSQVVNSIVEFNETDHTIHRYNCDYHDYVQQQMSLDGQLVLKQKVESRYIAGDEKHRISHAKEVAFIPDEARLRRNKNFGGSGFTSGDKFKGIKNAKRFGSL